MALRSQKYLFVLALLLNTGSAKYFERHSWAPMSIKELAELSQPIDESGNPLPPAKQGAKDLMQTEEDNMVDE